MLERLKTPTALAMIFFFLLVHSTHQSHAYDPEAWFPTKISASDSNKNNNKITDPTYLKRKPVQDENQHYLYWFHIQLTQVHDLETVKSRLWWIRTLYSRDEEMQSIYHDETLGISQLARELEAGCIRFGIHSIKKNRTQLSKEEIKRSCKNIRVTDDLFHRDPQDQFKGKANEYGVELFLDLHP